MGILSRFSRNLDLMSRMFSQTGALDRAVAGASMNEELRGAILRCSGCEHTQACAKWLDEGGEDRIPPAFCANSGLQMELRERL